MSEMMKINGYIHIRIFDRETNETKDERIIENTMCTKGFNKYLEAVFSGDTVESGTFLAIGTTATSEAAGDTDMEAEVDRKGGTFSHTEDTAQGTVAYTFSTGGPWALVEMGLFDDSSAGTMISRGTFATVNKGTADSFEATYVHELS